jgi:hypothetical protein
MERCRQVKRGDRLVHHLSSRYPGSFHHQTHAQQVFVWDRVFEVEAVIPQELTMIGGVDNQGGVAKSQRL